MDAAPEKELIVHVASYHADRSKDYNERNFGLGLRLREPGDRLALAAGFYRNSVWRETLYGGVAYDVAYVGPATLRVLGGIATGYDFPLIPVIVPELALSWGRVGVAVNFIPPMDFGGAKVSAVWALSLTARF